MKDESIAFTLAEIELANGGARPECETLLLRRDVDACALEHVRPEPLPFTPTRTPASPRPERTLQLIPRFSSRLPPEGGSRPNTDSGV